MDVVDDDESFVVDDVEDVDVDEESSVVDDDEDVEVDEPSVVDDVDDDVEVVAVVFKHAYCDCMYIVYISCQEIKLKFTFANESHVERRSY